MPDSPELLQFPCAFPIKIMGHSHDDLPEVVAAIAARFDPGFDAASMRLRPSSRGNYLAVSITVTATSRQQLDDLYRALSGHPMVKVVL